MQTFLRLFLIAIVIVIAIGYGVDNDCDYDDDGDEDEDAGFADGVSFANQGGAIRILSGVPPPPPVVRMFRLRAPGPLT